MGQDGTTKRLRELRCKRHFSYIFIITIMIQISKNVLQIEHRFRTSVDGWKNIVGRKNLFTDNMNIISNFVFLHIARIVFEFRDGPLNVGGPGHVSQNPALNPAL